MHIKEDFHHLNNSILWNTLSEGQKAEVLLAYEESFDEKNLIPHEEIVKKLKKWLN